MEPLLLQDWVTVASSPNTLLNITQGADSWLDVSDYEDLIFYLDVKNAAANSVKMNYETAPVCHDASFLPMVTPFSLVTGILASSVLAAYANVPAAKYVRWRLTAISAGWTATFRIWLAAYSLR